MIKLFAELTLLAASLGFGFLATELTDLVTFSEPKTSAVSQVATQDEPATKQEKGVRFNRDIREILSDNCYACHGPDSGNRKAGFRLDEHEYATEDLGGYWAIVPGKPQESELVLRIMSEDPSEVMPPAKHRKKLSAEQKEKLVRWIEQGAQWESHWSLMAPVKVEPAELGESDWPRNAIDHFVLAKLRDNDIQPSPEASRRILIRRLYFDLIGLPPTPEQLEAFLTDDSPQAFEKIVDDLLASPHFGERMAIYWLDLVRYADTVGYHGDQDISVSPYRDYVINAFNRNVPFDQFTREQIAGDLLANSMDEQKIASGYNRLGMMSAEGGVQPEEYLTKYAADRVRTTASVWLGITLGCAECHDHKFDPFSIEDFYNFGAFFADIKERGLYSGANNSGDWGPSIDVPDKQLAGLLKPIDSKIESIKRTMLESRDQLLIEQDRWEQNVKRSTVDWTTLRPTHFVSHFKAQHKILDDNSILLEGKPTDEDVYILHFDIEASDISGIRLEALPHDTLPKSGPGRAGNGNFVVTELIVTKGTQQDIEILKKVFDLWPGDLKSKTLELSNATATFEQTASGNSHPDKKWSAASAIDQDRNGPTWGWAVLPQSGKSNEWVAQFADGTEFAENEKLTIVIHQYHGKGNHVLGRFRISVTSDSKPVADRFKSIPESIRTIISKKKSMRSVNETQQIVDYFFTIAPSLEPQRQQIEKLTVRRNQLVDKHTRKSLVTQATAPREMRVLPRGNWMDKTGDVAIPMTPAILPPLKKANESARATRADLANWIASPNNPLTARVFTNRLWKLFMGQGIAKVLDDFGSQGGWPSHPDLLDFLANEFTSTGWDIKRTIRMIVTSSTYRQSSDSRNDLAVIDPGNRLFARQARFRLDAEMVRDNALEVSGLLIKKIGGRSVKPYQPAGLYRHLNFPLRKYVADNGENQFRRGVYTHWQRQFLHPAMKSFDAPPREECTCERPRSNTPLSALVLLNDPSYIEAARNLAERAYLQSNDSTADSNVEPIEWMFRRAISRNPSAEEKSVLQTLYQGHIIHFAAHEKEARELTQIGISPRDESISVVEHAALTNVARTIMNLHEFITRN